MLSPSVLLYSFVTGVRGHFTYIFCPSCVNTDVFEANHVSLAGCAAVGNTKPSKKVKFIPGFAHDPRLQTTCQTL